MNHTKKYLKFMWLNKAYQFTVMPNGYVDAMGVFNKILKPLFCWLREQGFASVVYVDDTLLAGETYQECCDNIYATMTLLQNLGFTIHPTKSSFLPSQEIILLGFVINTQDMTITLTNEKKVKIHEYAKKLLVDTPTIREVAKFLGNLSASFEAFTYGRLFYRFIEIDKINALKLSKGKFDAPCVLSPTAKDEICWRRQNLLNSSRKMISAPTVDYIIHTDTSNLGWGAHDEDQTISGRWSDSEKTLHINCLEFVAIKLAIKSFLPRKVLVRHLRLMSDNSAAITYINKQEGTQSTLCNQLTKDIWIICMDKETRVSAAHILGKQNIFADTASRKFHDASEWMLSKNIFNHLIACFGMPEIDLFASSLNKQLHRYASWMPDPDALYIDAMPISWENHFVYLFPPFSMI